MTPAAIIRDTRADGVMLALSPAGTIKATGDSAAVNRWLAVIREHKAGIIEALKSGAGGLAYRWWRIYYRDREPEVVARYPEATLADILNAHPDALGAEPCEPATRRPERPTTAAEEAAIRAWLARIGETDPVTIAEVIDLCQQDADEWAYLLGHARETENDPPKRRAGAGA